MANQTMTNRMNGLLGFNTPFGPVNLGPSQKPPGMFGSFDPFGNGNVPTVAGQQVFPNPTPPVQTPTVRSPQNQVPGGYGQGTNPNFGANVNGMIRSSDSNQLSQPQFSGPPVPRASLPPSASQFIQNLQKRPGSRTYYPNSQLN